jgi:Xaa-Pro aminopeptidase
VEYLIPYDSRVPFDYETRKEYIDVPFPEEEYLERIRKIRNLMEKKMLEGLLVYSYPCGETDGAGHVAYLSSFKPLGNNAVVLLSMDGEPALIFDRITHREPIHSCIWTTWMKDVWPSTRDNIPVNIQSWIKEQNLDKKRIGLVGEKMIPWDIWTQVKAGLPYVEWTPISQEFNDIQKIKSDLEMKLMRKVCQITNEGMRAGVEAVNPGVAEGEIVGEIMKEFFVEGAHDLSFTSVIASGPRGGIKHSYPTPRKIRNGDLVYIDIGARYYGYHTDMSRVVMVGNPSPKQKEVLDYDREAYYILLDEMKPGVPVKEVYSLATELQEKTGLYEKYGKAAYLGFGGSHGMSTGFAEWSLRDGRTVVTPNLSPLAFEPMIVILNFGTVVIESMVAITQKGAEVLTPLKLDWM